MRPLSEVDLEFQALLCKKSGMRYENIWRHEQGEPPTYGEKEFDDLAEQFRALKSKVAAPESGVGPNGPSLQPTASAPDCLVGKPAVVATAANKPQRETITPDCSSCKRFACSFTIVPGSTECLKLRQA
jgi:hypothetical protein